VGDDRGVAHPTVETPPRRGGRGLRPLLWAGVALVLAGLVMLGYVAWQFYGTNVVSAHKQQRIVERTQRLWAAQPGVAARATAVRHREADALLRIPAFGSDYVLPVQQGTSDGVLAEGFGHFTGTAGPGRVGNYALAAHRVTHGEPLRDMPSLRPGDTVVVETRARRFTYRLDTDPNALTVSFSGVWVIGALPVNPVPGGIQPRQRAGQRLITLTTCSELFHTDNRMIVFGHLVGTAPR
jgi:sortase A